ncbi:hypothetical protein D9M72_540220 [compost metagenome]
MLGLDHQAVALVLVAGLVELGIDELAGAVGDAGDGAGHRRTVHMAVEHVHENRDAEHRFRAEVQLFRRQHRCDRRNAAIGWADHQIVVDRRHAFRVAEEIGAPGGEQEADPHQRLPQEAQHQRHDEEDRNEAITFLVHRDERIAHRIDQAHELYSRFAVERDLARNAAHGNAARPTATIRVVISQ